MSYPKLLFHCFFCLTTVLARAQDTIVFENKYPYLIEVVEESETKITYKKYGDLSNLAYIIEKRFVTEVRYANPEAGKSKFKPDTLTHDNRLELWVTRTKKGSVTNGLLHRMDDSTLILKKKSVLFEKNPKDAPEVVYIFPYSQINHISARKQNQIIQYALIGAGTGFFVGTLTGLSIFNDTKPCDPLTMEPGCDPSLSTPHTRWNKSWTLGFGAAGLGAVTGGIIGGVKIHIPIGGKKDLFNAAVPRIRRMERALRKK